VQEGTSVSTIVRRLEEQLQEAVPPVLPQQQRSNGTVPVREQLQAADGSIPSPPPTPNTNSGSNKKSNKLMAKLKKSSGGHAPIDFIMSSPSNFQHNVLVAASPASCVRACVCRLSDAVVVCGCD
jgi:hypothetical protein